MKIIYNVTVNIHPEIADEWLKWMKEKHLEEVLKTGCFTGYTLSRMITRQDDEEWPTYVVQYFAPSMDHFNTYELEHALALRSEGAEKFSDKMLAFRSLMELID